VRLITHQVNQGAGAALVSGFMQATKAYTFYMDADGQFDIYDLNWLLPYLGEYDGVFGYREDRQDPLMRKLNAWGWNQVVRFVFNVRVRDIDCAFKIFRTDYFHHVVLEARGALLLTEVVYKFARAGYYYTEVPVKHLPREAGDATGAKLSVILRAFREMFFYAMKWYHEEQHALSK
jgi:glycosyltransferase involved in cell wall biosynthesis